MEFNRRRCVKKDLWLVCPLLLWNFYIVIFLKCELDQRGDTPAGAAQSWKEVLFHPLLLKCGNLIKTSFVYLRLSWYSTLHIFLDIKCRSPLPASRSNNETWERNLFQVSLGKSYGPSLSSDRLYRHNSAEKMLLSSPLVTFQVSFRG